MQIVHRTLMLVAGMVFLLNICTNSIIPFTENTTNNVGFVEYQEIGKSHLHDVLSGTTTVSVEESSIELEEEETAHNKTFYTSNFYELSGAGLLNFLSRTVDFTESAKEYFYSSLFILFRNFRL